MHSYLFPQSYTHWLATRLPGTLHETLATCQNCAMLKPEGQTRDKGPFLVGLKCCTYFPYIPNFSLGSILNTLSPEQLQKLASQGTLLPVGLYPNTQQQQLVLQHGRAGFGRKQELLCPFFNSKTDSCSIWAYRPAVCTSYFCKSDRGNDGLKLWTEIESYLNHFEWKLACEILNRMGVHENALVFGQSAVNLETEPDEQEYFIEAAWNSGTQPFAIKTHEDKIRFYEKTAEIARQISSHDIGQLLDEKYLQFEEKLLALL